MNIQSKGQTATRQAIADGKLKPLDVCEICGAKRGTRHFSFEKHVAIIPHHFKGYNFPLDVWWICRSCNRKLINKHDNSLTLSMARDYVLGDRIVIAGICIEEKKKELVDAIKKAEINLEFLKALLSIIDSNF